MDIHILKGHKPQRERLGRLHSAGKIPQTLLFTGTSGIGKKTLARGFLAAQFCKSADPPCNSCETCHSIRLRIHPDYLELQPNEKGTIPIGSQDKKEPGTIRWLLERLSLKPMYGKYAVLIDGADRIPEEGQNALLKTIEEPTEGTCIILITPSPGRILPTILSRSFIMKFSPLNTEDLSSLLIEQGLDEATASEISPISGGSMETALLLRDEDIRTNIQSLGREISSVCRGAGILLDDFSGVLKRIGTVNLLDILINIYRHNLLILLNRGDYPTNQNAISDDIFIDDPIKIRHLIKILLTVKKGLTRNINIRNALKGLLYSGYLEGDSASLLRKQIPL